MFSIYTYVIVDTLTTLAWSPQQNEILAGRVNEPMRLCHGQSAMLPSTFTELASAAPCLNSD